MHLLHFMDSLRIRISILALIMWGSSMPLLMPYFGFVCTTSGLHHVIDSFFGTFSKMSISSSFLRHSFSGLIRWYEMCLGFWAVGIASGSTSSLASITWPVLGSFICPKPSKMSWNCLSRPSTPSLLAFTALILSSFLSARDPSSTICSMPSSIRLGFPISGDDLILPLMMRNLVWMPHVWFLSVTSISPSTFSLHSIVLSFIMVGFITMLLLDKRCIVQSWY